MGIITRMVVIMMLLLCLGVAEGKWPVQLLAPNHNRTRLSLVESALAEVEKLEVRRY